MASTSAPVFLSSSSTLVDGKGPRQQAASPHGVTLPPTPVASHNRLQNGETRKMMANCRRISRNVAAMATGDTPVEVATELPEFVKSTQEAWEKLEDKYAVTSLVLAAIVGLWASLGMLSAIDRLPLVPGVLELVGIGYTGWFTYRNLVFKPDREALITKVKDAYKEVIGSN